jgi:hypothetical protein
MAHVIHTVLLPEVNSSEPDRDETPPLQGAIARLFIRRDASSQSLQDIEAFLKKAAVGEYAIGQAGSIRSGYWPTIDVTNRRDLDRVRAKARHLIDGWKELT